MTEETKNPNQIEDAQSQKIANQPELKDQDLDEVAGGGTNMPYKDWGKKTASSGRGGN